MSYRLARNESVQAALRRIAHEQMAKVFLSLDAADSPDANGEVVDEAIHDLRKRCKKLRALVRLVRPGFEKTYRRENDALRDAARRLGSARDATARLACFDRLTQADEERLAEANLEPWRKALQAERRKLADDTDALASSLSDFRRDMDALRSRIDSWTIQGNGLEALLQGYEKTYRRGRKAMRAAYREPSAEAFHEWRKRVKYHRYHVRLIGDVWQPVMKARRRAMHKLSDYLGDDHDLAVLGEHLKATAKTLGDEATCESLLAVVRAARQRLEEKARPLGAKLYAEKPNDHVRRIEACWRAWQRS